jgi:hypothetical protein
MITFTSTIPDDLSKQLNEKAKSLSLPKNKLIENALRLYLEHLERAEYIKSYKQASEDNDILLMAEEGMEDYLRQTEE